MSGVRLVSQKELSIQITSYFSHVRTPTSFLKLKTRRNVEFGVILCREKCSHGQSAPNAFLAFQENPRRIRFACMFWDYFHAMVITASFSLASSNEPPKVKDY